MMAIPAYLASSFRYLSVANVTDVDTIISNVRSECVTNGSPAWTEPSANLFKSPVDAVGRFFDILLTRSAATKLEFRVRDQNAVALCTRRIHIDASNEVRIYSGQFHLYIESIRSGGGELAYAGILDETPEAQNSHSDYAYGHGYRDTSDVALLVTSSLISRAYMLDNGATADGGDDGGGRILSNKRIDDSNAFPVASPTGALITRPVEHRANISGTMYFVGRRYQTITVPASLAFAAETVVPIDTATTATFKVLHLDTAVNSGFRLAVRKA